MESTLEWYLIRELVPNCKWSGLRFGAENFKWLDKRPFPTEAEIQVAYTEFKAKNEAEKNYDTALKKYTTTLEEGYVYEGVRYYCNDKGTDDLVKALTLYNLNVKGPIPVLDMDGVIHRLKINEFRKMASALGSYQYEVRMTFWREVGAK
jgi:hypothetical protein